MSDSPCNGPFLKCPDAPKNRHETSAYENRGTMHNHNIDRSLVLNLGFTSINLLKTKRTFTVTTDQSRSWSDLKWIKSCGCAFEQDCYAWCGTSKLNFSASVSENCSIEKNTILYSDLKNKVIFYKEEKEILNFTATSTDISQMKQKFGTSNHNKVKIKNAKIKGTENFILIWNGEKINLNSITYEKEPAWGMGPIGIPNANSGTTLPTDCEKYDKDIQQILLFPQPPSKAIPLDHEVLCKGFYDYGNSAPGEESHLIKSDGGKDYFYPSWVRSMIVDPFYVKETSNRYDMVWLHLPPNGVQEMIQPEIFHESVPCGNAVFHEVLGNYYCFAFTDYNGKAHIKYGGSANIPSYLPSLPETGAAWAFHPISVI